MCHGRQWQLLRSKRAENIMLCCVCLSRFADSGVTWRAVTCCGSGCTCQCMAGSRRSMKHWEGGGLRVQGYFPGGWG